MGWSLLLYFTYAVRPDPVSIGVGLFLLFVALVGTCTPVVCYLNFRYRTEESYREHWGRPLRQAAFVSLYIVICSLLRILGLFGWTTVLLFLAVLLATEIALISWLR